MATVCRLSLNPYKVEAVMTAVGNSGEPVTRSIDGLLMEKKIVGDFVSSSKVVGTWCRVL